MVRRSTPNGVLAERYFPVRLRVVVPPRGFGQQLKEVHAWLDAHVGPGAYWAESELRPGLPDAAPFYFLDVNAAQAFVNRFACAMAVRLDARPEDRPR